MQDRSPPTRQNLLATHGRTIHLGQKRTWRLIYRMSALPPKADIVQHGANVCSVRLSDIRDPSCGSITLSPRA